MIPESTRFFRVLLRKVLEPLSNLFRQTKPRRTLVSSKRFEQLIGRGCNRMELVEKWCWNQLGLGELVVPKVRIKLTKRPDESTSAGHRDDFTVLTRYFDLARLNRFSRNKRRREGAVLFGWKLTR